MTQGDLTMRSVGDIYISLRTRFVSLGGLRWQGMLHLEFDSDGRLAITYMLENDSPRLDKLNEYRPQDTAVEVNTVVHKILVQLDRTSVGKTQ